MPTRQEMRSLAEDIVHSYEDRIGEIAQLKETVQTLRQMAHTLREAASTEMKQLRSSRLTTARKLRSDLSKSAAEMKTAVGTQLRELDTAHQAMARRQRADLAKGHSDLAKGHSDLRSNVASLLREVHAAHQTMAKRQRTDLAKVHSDLKQDVGTMLKGFDAELKGVHAAHAGARDEWRKMTATMQAKRETAVAVAPPPPTEIAEEGSALGSMVFKHLADHPDGTRLVELEQRFGVARIQMARILKSLMGENRVEKQDLLYFAA